MSTSETLAAANPDTHIHKVRYQAFEKARVYRRAMDSGTENVELKQELAHAILDYYEELWRDRSEPVAKSQWEDLNVDAIEARVGKQVTVQTETPGRGRNASASTRPAITTVPFHVLRDELRKLDEIYKALGYSPDVNEAERPTGVIDFEQ